MSEYEDTRADAWAELVDAERRDEQAAERIEDGDEPAPWNGPDYFLELVTAELEARASFHRWLEHGGRRRWPDHPRLEVTWPAFWMGWRDSAEHVSDFKRRSMAHDDRDAYMSGRFLSSANRQRKERPCR